MLSLQPRSNYCIESFNNPFWFRWLREHRNEAPVVPTSVSILNVNEAGKVVNNPEAATMPRGERTIHPRRISGFTFFNDFEITTTKPVETTLSFPSQQPQLSNGVTFANLVERARLRTAEDFNTTPLTPEEVDEELTTTMSSSTTTSTTTTTLRTTTTPTTTTTTTTTTTRPITTLGEFLSSRAASRYKPRAINSASVRSAKLIKNRVPLASRFVITKQRQRQSFRARKPIKESTTTTTTTTLTTTTTTSTTTTSTTSTTTTSTTTSTIVPTTSRIITSIGTSSERLVTRTVTSTEEAPNAATEYYTELPTTTEEYETTTLPMALPLIILSGQYHETNPGQYHEVNPGQYHEVNPGQYHEVNPGQYNEVNPGAYPELEEEDQQKKQSLDEVQVEVKEREKTKIYNVQSKVDKFIIGEYGTISKESGQTLKGVRYTARDDVSIDPNLIYETLVKFFPMHNHQEA